MHTSKCFHCARHLHMLLIALRRVLDGPCSATASIVHCCATAELCSARMERNTDTNTTPGSCLLSLALLTPLVGRSADVARTRGLPRQRIQPNSFSFLCFERSPPLYVMPTHNSIPWLSRPLLYQLRSSRGTRAHACSSFEFGCLYLQLCVHAA